MRIRWCTLDDKNQTDTGDRSLFSRPLSWSSVYGANPQSNATHRRAWPGFVVWPAVGWSRQRRAGLGWKRPWCLLHIRGRCGGQIFAQTRHGPNMQGAPGKVQPGGFVPLITEAVGRAFVLPFYQRNNGVPVLGFLFQFNIFEVLYQKVNKEKQITITTMFSNHPCQ